MKQAILPILLLLCALCPAWPAQASALPHGKAALSAVSAACTDTDTLRTDSLPLPERIRELLRNEIFERTQVGIYVYDLTADTLVFSHNERQCMRPASNEKLVTAITALHTLGGDYRYQTQLFVEGDPADSIFRGTIAIRGGYDPLFSKEDMDSFAHALKGQGITCISTPIRFDLSFKDDKEWGWGWCWDDDEVPLTPLLYNNRDQFAEMLHAALRRADITWNGSVKKEKVPHGARLLCTRTHTIDQALLPMMKESDNSVAESLFYQIAAANGRAKAGRKQAVKHIKSLVSDLGLDPDHYQFADGSGLSLYNYLTPQLLGYLLRHAYSRPDIYRHLLPSLPIAGEDGTLRKRMRGSKAAGNVRAKTGTVEGVSTLSGYCTAANGHTLCFSIMNQGIRRTSTGRSFQDRVCKALCR